MNIKMITMDGTPLIRENYIPDTHVFQVESPEIASGAVYYFKSESGLCYQVTFGKKKSNYMGNIINFSVLSDDYEDEYSVTNKGEVWKIINTMIEVVRIFHENHPYSNTYEFSGEFKEGEDNSLPSIRTRLFLRATRKIVNMKYWNIITEKNKVILTRK